MSLILIFKLYLPIAPQKDIVLYPHSSQTNSLLVSGATLDVLITMRGLAVADLTNHGAAQMDAAELMEAPKAKEGGREGRPLRRAGREGRPRVEAHVQAVLSIEINKLFCGFGTYWTFEPQFTFVICTLLMWIVKHLICEHCPLLPIAFQMFDYPQTWHLSVSSSSLFLIR